MRARHGKADDDAVELRHRQIANRLQGAPAPRATDPGRVDHGRIGRAGQAGAGQENYAEQDQAAHKLLKSLGMEPLSDGFLLKTFMAGLKASRAPIKQVLLAGHLVVGVGNIYAAEALFAAKINPSQSANKLTYHQCQLLSISNQHQLVLLWHVCQNL